MCKRRGGLILLIAFGDGVEESAFGERFIFEFLKVTIMELLLLLELDFNFYISISV